MSDPTVADRPSTAAALPARLHPSIVPLSPTTAWRWRRCRRLYLLRNLAQLPTVDSGPWTSEGLRVHAVLQQLHDHGDCGDRDWRDEVVETYGGGDAERLRGFIERHASRCPRGATYLGGEVPLGRFHRDPPPLFTASGSIDALWVHDGYLDARDYKTGGGSNLSVADDIRARVQAWLLAPVAAERRLRLRLRYEFLAPEVAEDPPPWDPEPEQLDQVDEDLRLLVEEMREEREFVGVNDLGVCRTCEYRTICVDAAVSDD